MTRRATCGINLLGKLMTRYAGRFKKKNKKKKVCQNTWFVLLPQCDLSLPELSILENILLEIL